MDATPEVDVGMVTLPARVVMISNDPKTTEYFQRRVGSLVFIAKLTLDNGESCTCATGDPEPCSHPAFPDGDLSLD